MSETDIATKKLIRQIVRDMGIYLLGLDIKTIEEAPSELQRIETRRAVESREIINAFFEQIGPLVVPILQGLDRCDMA